MGIPIEAFHPDTFEFNVVVVVFAADSVVNVVSLLLSPLK